MSEKDKNSKLSDFDFDGDNSASDKVIDSSMVDAKKSSNFRLIGIFVTLLFALFKPLPISSFTMKK